MLGAYESCVMKEIGPVVVATDLSENAELAVCAADDLAQSRRTELVVVHVLPELFSVHPLFPQLNLPDAFSLSTIERKAVAAVARRVSELTARPSDGFGVRLRSGSPHDAILDIAEEEDASALVIGAHSDGLEGILGNVTRQGVRHARTSVLVVRPGLHKRQGPVVVATDFSSHAKVAMKHGQAASARMNKDLVLLYSLDFVPTHNPLLLSDVGLPSHSDMAEVQRTLGRMLEAEATAIGADPMLRTGPAWHSVAEAAGELSSPMVVVATHGRTGMGRLALGSVAEKVVEKAPCSVLVARATDD